MVAGHNFLAADADHVILGEIDVLTVALLHVDGNLTWFDGVDTACNTYRREVEFQGDVVDVVALGRVAVACADASGKKLLSVCRRTRLRAHECGSGT